MLKQITQNNDRKAELLFYALLATIVTILLIIRAIKVPMAHDEIATFFYFVQNGKISPFFSNFDTNNHFLNSLLMWISYNLSGNSPLSLRLPNLLFIPIFFYALYKLTSFIKKPILRILFFTSLATTLHFVEFLALARGYGMSLTMMLLSLFQIIQWTKSKQTKHLIFSLTSIFIASLANLALINFYALLLAFIVIMLLLKPTRKPIKTGILIAIFGIIPFVFVVLQILYIKSNAGLIAGAPTNFWQTTIESLFGYLFELKTPYSSIVPTLLFLMLFIAYALLSCQKIKKGTFVLTTADYLTYFFAGCILSMIILGEIFHINYPDDRIATYLYPLFLLSFVFIIDELIEFYQKKFILLSAFPLLLIPIHFFIYLNFSYSIWYKYDVIPQRFFNTVMAEYKVGDTPPTIAAHGMRIFCWSYLNYRSGGNASSIFFTTFPCYNADYQIVNLKMIPKWNTNYDTIDYDPISERHLLKLKVKAQFVPLISHTVSMQSTDQEYIILCEGATDTLLNKCIQINFDLQLLAEQIPLNARIVVDITDNQSNSLCYEYIQCNWLRANWNIQNKDFINCMLIDKVPNTSTHYKVYIWNIDKNPISVQGNISLNERKL